MRFCADSRLLRQHRLDWRPVSATPTRLANRLRLRRGGGLNCRPHNTLRFSSGTTIETGPADSRGAVHDLTAKMKAVSPRSEEGKAMKAKLDTLLKAFKESAPPSKPSRQQPNQPNK
jgi:hypothetical protein